MHNHFIPPQLRANYVAQGNTPNKNSQIPLKEKFKEK